MIIGIPKEKKDLESRVGLTPKWVKNLIEQGHEVLFQKDLGTLARIDNDAYKSVGATMVDTVEDVYRKSDLVLKLKDYMPSERDLPFKEGQIIMCYFHLGEIEPDRPLVDKLLSSKSTAVSLELIRDDDGGRPMMKPMSEIAGRLAVLSAIHHSMLPEGSGVCLAAVDGIEKPKIVILGGGVCGLAAAKVAEGLNAQTVVIEASYDRMCYLSSVLRKSELLLWNEDDLRRHVVDCDVFINTIYPIPGMKLPLVTREMVREMKPRSMLVDLVGCNVIETMRYTTISDPIYIEEGILHFGVDNLPALVPRTSCEAFAQAVYPFVEAVANKGIRKACADDARLARAMSTVNGKLVHKDIADTHEMEYEEFDISMV